jgi:hypothetical protein
VRITVELTAPNTGDAEQRRDRMVAASYLLDNVAKQIGNGVREANMVNRSFGIEATFTVSDDVA